MSPIPFSVNWVIAFSMRCVLLPLVTRRRCRPRPKPCAPTLHSARSRRSPRWRLARRWFHFSMKRAGRTLSNARLYCRRPRGSVRSPRMNARQWWLRQLLPASTKRPSIESRPTKKSRDSQPRQLRKLTRKPQKTVPGAKDAPASGRRSASGGSTQGPSFGDRLKGTIGDVLVGGTAERTRSSRRWPKVRRARSDRSWAGRSSAACWARSWVDGADSVNNPNASD